MPFKKQTDTKTTERPYEYKISLGKDINGKLIRKSFYSPKSKADAKRKAEKYKARYELELLCGGQEDGDVKKSRALKHTKCYGSEICRRSGA